MHNTVYVITKASEVEDGVIVRYAVHVSSSLTGAEEWIIRDCDFVNDEGKMRCVIRKECMVREYYCDGRRVHFEVEPMVIDKDAP